VVWYQRRGVDTLMRGSVHGKATAYWASKVRRRGCKEGDWRGTASSATTVSLVLENREEINNTGVSTRIRRRSSAEAVPEDEYEGRDID
jgi:hypothetical protein